MKKVVGNLVVEAHFTHEDEFIRKGQYKPTSLDERKAKADFLITAIDGSRTTVQFNIPVELSAGRGIERCKSNPRIYYVTDRELAKLKSRFSYECDF
mgnify:FL=1